MKVIPVFSCLLMTLFEIIMSWYLCNVSGCTSFQFLSELAAVQVDSGLCWISHWDHPFCRSCCCISPSQSVLHLSLYSIHKYKMRHMHCSVLFVMCSLATRCQCVNFSGIRTCYMYSNLWTTAFVRWL